MKLEHHNNDLNKYLHTQTFNKQPSQTHTEFNKKLIKNNKFNHKYWKICIFWVTLQHVIVVIETHNNAQP